MPIKKIWLKISSIALFSLFSAVYDHFSPLGLPNHIYNQNITFLYEKLLPATLTPPPCLHSPRISTDLKQQ